MLMTTAEFRLFVNTDESDEMLAARLKGIELLIRGLTNNNFQARGFRCIADIVDGTLYSNGVPFAVGDTVQISQSVKNDGLYTVKSVNGDIFTLNEAIYDETEVVCTKVVYPNDVVLGCVELLKWEYTNRDKAGIASETISRHSVSYVNLSAAGNSEHGYPTSLLGFLTHYKKARF